MYAIKNSKWIFLMAFIGIFMLNACGGSGSDSGGKSPSVTFNIDTKNAINTSQVLVATFNQSMDVDKVKLGGNMAGLSDGGVWSKTKVANDTFTLSPNTYWDASAPGTLTVTGKDKKGNALNKVSLHFKIIISFSNFQEASVVVGQPNFMSNAKDQNGSIGPNGFGSMYGTPGYFEGILYLPDYGNDRILGFDGIPTTNNANADFVIGQANLTSNDIENTTDSFMDGAEATVAFDGKLFVLELSNKRISIFNTPPTTSTPTIDVVVGQSNFTSDDSTCTDTHLNNPEGMFVAGGKLVVSDTNHNRVLIWNSIPTTNGVPADIVLGQNSFTTCMSNNDNQDGSSDVSPSARTLNGPTGIWTDGRKLVVNDSENNRTLIWNTFPTSNFTHADIVLGQNSFTKKTMNDDNHDGTPDETASARTMSYPFAGLYSNGTQLVIGDFSNNRVLIWNKFPTSNFEPADIVLGQGDFEHMKQNDENQDGDEDDDASAQTLYKPTGVLIVGNQLIVADQSNYRYLIFNGE